MLLVDIDVGSGMGAELGVTKLVSSWGKVDSEAVVVLEVWGCPCRWDSLDSELEWPSATSLRRRSEVGLAPEVF